jgi:hypothetical protein
MDKKSEYKEMILKEISLKLDKMFDSVDESPKDLYQLEKMISSFGSNIEHKAFETIEKYNQNNSKKKLP